MRRVEVYMAYRSARSCNELQVSRILSDADAPRHASVMAAVLTLSALMSTVCWGASAVDVKDMIGKWRWQQFTIEVAECQNDSVCAKVVAGPKNVGMQLFATDLVAKDGNLVGQITHPETKEVYNTRFQPEGPDKWRLDGCTATRVCLSGEFVRVKQ
jgi:hypothetical protein